MSTWTPYNSSLSDCKRFRVVRIAAGQWQDPIWCKLIHRKLDEAPGKHPYRALSYVWGSASVIDTIYLEGGLFKITLNLSCALRHLRKVDEDSFLWVDALCINQQNHLERSLQVSIMQSIYKNAEEVVVFMGDGRGHRVSHAQLTEPPVSPTITLHGYERDKAFLTSILRSGQTKRRRKPASSMTVAACAMSLISLFSDQETVEEGCMELMKMTEKDRCNLFEHFRTFVTCPWWSRIWVVQEIAVGTAVTIQYGTITLSWETLVATATVWSLPRTRQVATTAGIEPENIRVFTLFANQLNGLEQTRRKWHAEGGTDLVRLLQEFSDRQASDDRDKVYGLLSLVKQGQRYIVPNYTLDVFETYRATALALLENGGSLACWSGDQKRKFNRGLPSWIPDWSTAVDNGDKRRMDLFNSYDTNCGWTLKIIKSEREYWATVEDQMELLINSPAGKAGLLPASLKPFVLDYIDRLKKWSRSLLRFSVDPDEFDRLGVYNPAWDKRQEITSRSILVRLEWCELHDVTPRSGLNLLRRWIDQVRFCANGADFADDTTVDPQTEEDSPAHKIIYMSLKFLDSLLRKKNIDTEYQKMRAARAIHKIEDIFLGVETIVAADKVISKCHRLADLHKTTESSISPHKLFGMSYSLQEQAFRLNGIREAGKFLPGSLLTHDARLSDMLPMQMVRVDDVAVKGHRQFGWTNTESALTTLVSWLYLSGPVLISGTGAERQVWLKRDRIRQFARTILGGMCRHGDSYRKVDDSALSPLEEWLGQCLMDWPDHPNWSRFSPLDWMQTPDGISLGYFWMDDGSGALNPPEYWIRRSLAAGGFALPPSPFLEDIVVATDSRVFFLTKNGSMGLGPASIQKEDSINVLPSGRAHFVLRHKPSRKEPPDPGRRAWISRLEFNQYELIGDCYLDTDSTLDSRTPSEEEPGIEGSLPFEVLGDRYWEKTGKPMRETIMLA